MWTLLFLAVGWAIGFGLYLLVAMQALLSLTFGLPASIMLRRRGLLTSRAPIYRYVAFAAAYVALFIAMIWGVRTFLPAGGQVGVAIGLAWGVVETDPGYGYTEGNIDDFLRLNKKHLLPAAGERLRQLAARSSRHD